ncbi:ral guanine nucleotide dissociation stimulator isoform X1 [Pelobates cultripes]|uniref:Ral guanine nucleotide dissociation stimulator isoform X1 n=1 Tax=Pelobates cultripes TaxID=61616 RepID=A0AAD1RH68_PELCU|nr:ral guanine nucleotide dissociation stimulator isoform X1 [Pelobates cultripes]
MGRCSSKLEAVQPKPINQNTNSGQVIGEEVEDGIIYTISESEVRFGPNKGKPLWFNRKSGLSETRKVRTVKAGTLEKLVEHLVHASKANDSAYVTTFLWMYRPFATTKQVLDLLLNNLNAENLNDNPDLKNTISFILGVWLDQHSEDFRDAPGYECLKQIIRCVQQSIPGSDLESRACNLLTQVQQEQNKELAQEGDPSTCNPPIAKESSLLYTTIEEVDLFSIPPKKMAEQLTALDADIFQKVVLYDCLGCVFSKKDTQKNKHVAPTVRAVVDQCHHVYDLVMSTCLKDLSMTAQERAKVIEYWMDVAIECRDMKNFSSLRAICGAVDCTPILRLKKSWEGIPTKKVKMFYEFVELFKVFEEYEALLLKESTTKCATADVNNKKAKKRLKKQKKKGVVYGTIPYMGLHLWYLTFLDTRNKNIKRGLINFQKRQEEFEVLATLKLLQASCNNYRFTIEESFLNWFHSVERLSCDETYLLSWDIEPLSNSAREKMGRQGLLRKPSNSSEPIPATTSQPKSTDHPECSPQVSDTTNSGTTLSGYSKAEMKEAQAAPSEPEGPSIPKTQAAPSEPEGPSNPEA